MAESHGRPAWKKLGKGLVMAMKEWVVPFLRQQGDSNISIEELERELEVPVFCHRRIAALFKTYEFTQRLTDALGYVGSCLPFEDFYSIRSMENLIFLYDNGSVLASVQGVFTDTFHKCVVIVHVSRKAADLSDSQLAGLFAHELGHVHLRHFDGGFNSQSEKEMAADAIAEGWGFQEELASLKKGLPSLI